MEKLDEALEAVCQKLSDANLTISVSTTNRSSGLYSRIRLTQRKLRQSTMHQHELPSAVFEAF